MATAFVDEPVAGAAMWHVAANVFVVEPVASAVVWPGAPMIPTPKATGLSLLLMLRQARARTCPPGNANQVPHMTGALLSQCTVYNIRPPSQSAGLLGYHVNCGKCP